MQNNNRNKIVFSLPYLIVMIFVISMLFMNPFKAGNQTLTYPAFVELLDSGKIEKASVSVNYNTTNVSGVYKDGDKSYNFTSTIPNTDSSFDNLLDKLSKTENVTISDANESNFFIELVGTFLPVIIFLGFGYFMLKSLNGDGANKQAFDFSKSRARLESDIKVRFADVAGCDEEKEEIRVCPSRTCWKCAPELPFATLEIRKRSTMFLKLAKLKVIPIRHHCADSGNQT